MTVATVQVNADSGAIRLRVGGEIDLDNAETIGQEIFTAVPDSPTGVSVDLTNVTYMDSVGIRILFDLASRLQESGLMLELIASLDSPARQLIDLSGIDDLTIISPPRDQPPSTPD